MAKTKILLADDHAIVRAGLRAILAKHDDVEVVGEAKDGQEAIDLARVLMPDVVVLDISMPRLNGLMAARRICEEHPAIKVLMLTQHDNPEYVLPLMEAGAAGYVLKQAADTDLIAAIRAVARGDSYLYPPVAKVVLDAYLAPDSANPYQALTPREREVLILTAQGKTNREMADTLQISPKTVDVHRTHMMEKLSLHNVAEVTRYAVEHGLLGT